MAKHGFGQSDNNLSQETSIVTALYVVKPTIRR